jgi:hypothetical protein
MICFNDLNLVSHVYCTAAHNLGAEAAAVEQGFFDAGERAAFKIAARFTEFDPAQDHRPDLKLDTDQMIQRDTFGKQISACQQRLDRQLIVPRRGYERFALDERDLVHRLGRLSFGAAIAGETTARDSLDLGHGDERGTFARGELDGAELALEWHGDDFDS